MGAKLEFHETFARMCRMPSGLFLRYNIHIVQMQKNIMFQRMQIKMKIVFGLKLQIAIIKCYVALNTCRMYSLLYNHMVTNLE